MMIFMTEQEFRNVSDLEFKNIDDEEFRSYTFVKEGKIYFVTIGHPLKLHVSASGGHRIFDADGVCHYIPSGWIHLKWKAKEGEDHFRF